MNADAITVVINARNAAPTIARAVRSAAPFGVLLVDDASTDGTAEAALAAAGGPLRIVRNTECQGLGHARRVALAAVETPFLAWLDADDEYLPGRLAQLWPQLEAGADLVFDAAVLHDGTTDRFLRQVPVPEFLLPPGALVRSFERNYLPGSAWPFVRTAFARRVDFDSAQTSGEDIDFLLRALAGGGRAAASPTFGYKQYAYGTSLSRNLPKHRTLVTRALRKHDYATVASLYRAAGYSERVTAWGLYSFALFREEPDRAFAFLPSACPAGSDPRQVLEADGPLPVPEGWRLGFCRGTLHCLLGRPAEALGDFAAAAAHDLGDILAAGGIVGTPDLLNNWGVALAQLGRQDEARAKFAAAVALFPGYVDAVHNLAAPAPDRITIHPLRRQPSRREY